jgi:hypothetical protein
MPRLLAVLVVAPALVAAAGLGPAGEPPPGEAAPGGRTLLVLANRQRPESDIPLRTLVRVFRGEQRFWDNGDRVYPVLPPEDESAIRELFLTSVVKLDARGFALHWKNLVFRGDVTDQPVSPADERRAVQSVFAERGGLALVEGGQVKNLDQVAKILTVNGRDRDAADYPLKW